MKGLKLSDGSFLFLFDTYSPSVCGRRYSAITMMLQGEEMIARRLTSGSKGCL